MKIGFNILARAWLLVRYKAASHLATRNKLKAINIEVIHQREVIDRNRITDGVASADIQFRLTKVAKLDADRVTKIILLGLDYNTDLPVNCGSSEQPSPKLSQQVVKRFSKMA
jgi:cyclohexyl-isocyanide hydratase